MRNLEKVALSIVPEIIFSDGHHDYSIDKATGVEEVFENNKYYLKITTMGKLFDFEEEWRQYSRQPIRVFWYVRAFADGVDYSRSTIYKNWKLVSFESEANSEKCFPNKYVIECDIRMKEGPLKSC